MLGKSLQIRLIAVFFISFNRRQIGFLGLGVKVGGLALEFLWL